MKDAVDLRCNATEGDLVDVRVSCDGTWQKRGFQSNNGIYVAISVYNGKVLDLEVMSRVCKAFVVRENLKTKNPIKYAEWQNTHIYSYNYQGS